MKMKHKLPFEQNPDSYLTTIQANEKEMAMNISPRKMLSNKTQKRTFAAVVNNGRDSGNNEFTSQSVLMNLAGLTGLIGGYQ